ncbi:MAG TPA: hypothetical protein VH796_14050, partial [Nitrososphaeraceae archaeon]
MTSKDLSGSRNMHTISIIVLAAVILSGILPLTIYQVAFSKSHKDDGSSDSTTPSDSGNSNSNIPPQQLSGSDTGQTPPAGTETGQTPPAGTETGQTPPAGTETGQTPPAGTETGQTPP